MLIVQQDNYKQENELGLLSIVTCNSLWKWSTVPNLTVEKYMILKESIEINTCELIEQ